jgi:hypothetical protein
MVADSLEADFGGGSTGAPEVVVGDFELLADYMAIQNRSAKSVIEERLDQGA